MRVLPTYLRDEFDGLLIHRPSLILTLQLTPDGLGEDREDLGVSYQPSDPRHVSSLPLGKSFGIEERGEMCEVGVEGIVRFFELCE